MSREQFEAWISAPPHERSVERKGENGSWPGQYRSYETQVAWEAWQESAKHEREACAKVCDNRYMFIGDDADRAVEECAAAIRYRNVESC